MTRLNKSDLTARTATVNRQLQTRQGAEFEAGLHVQTQGRNGSTAVDLYDGTTCLTNLTVGTLREAATYLSGMAVGLALATRADNHQGEGE